LAGGCCCRVVGCCSYFENYTVDASILKMMILRGCHS
jgi:hypothetical protein